jgi:hypothetical protein
LIFLGSTEWIEGSGPTFARNAKDGVTVNLAVDSSSDPDKLEKQLKLLKKFALP